MVSWLGVLVIPENKEPFDIKLTEELSGRSQNYSEASIKNDRSNPTRALFNSFSRGANIIFVMQSSRYLIAQVDQIHIFFDTNDLFLRI